MKIEFDREELRAVVAEVLAEIIEKLDRQGDRLGYTEAEASALIGVAKHVLRDCRLRGEVRARLVGKKHVYERSELVRFLRGFER